MYEHAQMQQAVSEAFTFLPTYLGLLAEDHWLVQFRDMDADLDDEEFFPEGGEYLARGETDEEWFFAWRLANGRLMVARGLYPAFSSYDGVDLIAEVLPAATAEKVALDWVRSRSAEGSYTESTNDDDEPAADVAEFTTRQSPPPRPTSANGRQPTLWERLTGRR
jgi:hypothetical protein